MFKLVEQIKFPKALPKFHHIAQSYKTFKHEPLGEEEIPVAPYGGRHIVTMLPGDGIGPELMQYVEDIIKFIRAPIDFEKVDIRSGDTLQDDINNAVTSIKRNGVAIKGTIEPHLECENFRNPNVDIRNNLDLFVNIANWKSWAGVKSIFQNINIVVIRQNTEGEYSMLEHSSKPGVVESLKIITKSNTERISRWAFDFALRFHRKKVTIVHKANIMKVTDGLFLKTVKKISKLYPQVCCNDVIVDNCSMQLVTKPHQFDIIIMPNLYGTVLNNVLCGLTGGPGLTSGSNYGYDYAMFEPAVRTLGKSLAGQNRANPIAMLNSMVSLLYYLKQDRFAKILKAALRKTVVLDQIVTPDLGGTHTSTDMIKQIKNNIKELYYLA